MDVRENYPLRRVPLVVLEQPAEPGPAVYLGELQLGRDRLCSRSFAGDELVAQSLMRPLGVVVFQELAGEILEMPQRL